MTSSTTSCAPTDLTALPGLSAVDPARDMEPIEVVSGKRVLRVWSPLRPASAWAYLEDVGWRKVPAVTTDGDTGVLETCCRARTEGLRVCAVTTADEIRRLDVLASQAVTP